MDEDISTHMKALTIKANDTDSDPVAAASAGVALPIHTSPLEDALCSAHHEVQAEQKHVQKEKPEETREMFHLSPCLSAEVPQPWTDVAPEVSSSTSGAGGGEKKNSRKRRNRKKCKKVLFSWPVTLQIQASSTNPFPCQASDMGVFISSKEQRKDNKDMVKEKAVLLTHFWKESADALLPEASPVQPSTAAKKERNVQKGQHCKKKAKKNQKMASSPWPVTVQAWASFVRLDPGQRSFTESLPVATDGIKDDVSVLTLSKGTQVDMTVPGTNAKRKIKKKKKRKGWQGKMENALDYSWPPEIPAWVPFQAPPPPPPAAAAAAPTAADNPVQTLREDMSLQWKCWSPLENEKEKCFVPWSEGTEEGSLAIAPLQISLKGAPAVKIGQPKTAEAKRNPYPGEEQLQGSNTLDLESYDSWGNAEKYQRHQDEDDWECSTLDLTTNVDCYRRDLFSQEGPEDSTLTGSNAYTSVSEAKTGRQEAEDGKTTFETLWMGKWGGF